jgi:hypothetical protein
MSLVMFIVPLISAGWGTFAPAAGGAALSLGYSLINENINESKRIKREAIEMTIENSDILKEQLTEGKKMVYKKEDVLITFSADERGKCLLYVTGDNKSKTELRQIGKEMINKVTQQYVYDKVVTDLKQKGYSVVVEELGESNSLKISARKFASSSHASMGKEEVEIAIDDENKVSLHVKGIKGKGCVKVAQEISSVIGKEDHSDPTSEYYQPEPGVFISGNDNVRH